MKILILVLLILMLVVAGPFLFMRRQSNRTADSPGTAATNNGYSWQMAQHAHGAGISIKPIPGANVTFEANDTSK